MRLQPHSVCALANMEKVKATSNPGTPLIKAVTYQNASLAGTGQCECKTPKYEIVRMTA